MSARRHEPSGYDTSPSIRTILPHLLATNSPWTTELELEMLEFAEMCGDYALLCEKESHHKGVANNVLGVISMICSGGVAVYPHFAGLSQDGISYGVTAIAVVSLVSNAVQTVFNYAKGASLEIAAAMVLREISKQLRLEIAKPLALRWADPFAKMLELEEKFADTVQKISPKIVGGQAKSRLRRQQRARMKRGPLSSIEMSR